MSTISVKPNQSILDVVLQGCGSLESTMQIMKLNDRSISTSPAVGDLINLKASATDDPSVLKYLIRNGIVIGTLNKPPLIALGFTIVLYPRLKVRPHSITDPSILGYYNYDLIAAGDFVNIYPLLNSIYPSHPNRFDYQTTDEFTASDPYSTIDNYLTTVSMPPEDVEYRIPWLAGHDNMMVWSDLTMPTQALTFEDIQGNTAIAVPVIVLDASSQTVIENLCPDIHVEFISSDGATATLRLTMSHAAPATSPWAVYAMNWLDEAASGTPDPLDPANPLKTIVVYGPGMHLIGATASYTPDGSTVWPGKSVAEMAISIS